MRIAATAFVITLLGVPPPPRRPPISSGAEASADDRQRGPSATVTVAESRTGSAKQPFRSSHHSQRPPEWSAGSPRPRRPDIE